MARSYQLALAVLLMLLPIAPAYAGTCTPSPTVACLQDGRFSVTIDWMDFDTNTGAGQVLPLGLDDTTAFWFADPDLPELFIKVLDGTQSNNFFWVFYGSMSNWEYTVTVTDTVTEEQAIYFNPLGIFSSVTDTAALPGPVASATVQKLSAIGGDGSAIGGDRSAQGAIDGPETCVPDATTLCLEGGRFRIVVDWDSGGAMGVGDAFPVTGQSGYFTFFAPANIELMVKLFDGGQGSYGFFFGATTNVGYTITVTDVCSGAMQVYANALGVGPTSLGDFEAFPATATCLAIFADGFESGDTTAW